MPARRLNIRISEVTETVVEEIAKSRGLDPRSPAGELFEEAVRVSRIPGIVFRDEGQRREAKIGGTGLGVWEVVAAYQRMDEDGERLQEAID